MKHTPYIGITGFTKSSQVQDMVEVFEKHKRPDCPYRLHVGAMISYKNLYNIPNKWSKVFPKIEDVEEIFYHDNTMGCLHYADYDTDDNNVALSLSKAVIIGGLSMKALQLDMIWPNPFNIQKAINNTHRFSIEVILQIGKNAISDAFNDPEEIVQRIGEYDGLIHHVLLDESMGRGVGMNPDSLARFVRPIRKAFPKLGITVAGGLGPDSMELVVPLLEEFPGLSFDAQGQLCPEGNSLNPTDWKRAGEYLAKALKLV